MFWLTKYFAAVALDATQLFLERILENLSSGSKVFFSLFFCLLLLFSWNVGIISPDHVSAHQKFFALFVELFKSI